MTGLQAPEGGARWADLLARAAEGAARPRHICEICVEMLDVSGAGISIVTRVGNRGVVCATDDVSAKIEDLQFSLGEGPCVDAVVAAAPVLIGDLDGDSSIAVDRWPTFLPAASGAGVRAAFAFPLRIGAINVGALDLYRDRAGDLTVAQLSGALMAADAAALSLLFLTTAGNGAFDGDRPSRSDYRLQVHQATGMVQVQLDVTTEVALLALRARAFSTGRPLADIADDVVRRRLRFASEDE